MPYSCPECRKRFRTESALKMHNQAKHKGGVVRQELPPKGRRWWFWLPILMIVGGAAATGVVAAIIK